MINLFKNNTAETIYDNCRKFSDIGFPFVKEISK